MARAAEPTSVDDALRSFSDNWQEEDWVPKTGVRTRFMRPLDEQGWKARMSELSNRPATFIIDKQGVIRYARLGESFSDRPRPSEIIEELKKLDTQ